MATTEERLQELEMSLKEVAALLKQLTNVLDGFHRWQKEQCELNTILADRANIATDRIKMLEDRAAGHDGRLKAAALAISALDDWKKSLEVPDGSRH